ncbi:MAG: hypothetical protein DYG83_13065 [Candidatus Brocadia sp. AMX2]|uniref:Uncharacterized protein n=1 Tax=Candidatus Brocadia sinica JPN1 TaxID=1197129 RepID=A0ABQ0JXY7_9BACT|nr:hypothetical protein [Candidatus Brocadia sp.]MCE7867721.1 hypothetical protein [Candidatus Brocadia sp. AMX2]GAN33595.1 hypothetical protein BROSI_A2121 [Candidatus Brocadia sinica JPN1]GIK13423.1 MAG: hypothetical protein BroJett002_21300 [Candidatus Brocadia sinica]GJQ18372.1 MAG: hypothetical protein HBSIN01_23310 [Candidatus Brocadia sinica]
MPKCSLALFQSTSVLSSKSCYKKLSSSPKFRDVPVKTLLAEVQLLETKLKNEKVEAVTNENYEVAALLENLVDPVKELHGEALLLTLDDVTDDRYKIEDRKLRILLNLVSVMFQLKSTRNLQKSILDFATFCHRKRLIRKKRATSPEYVEREVNIGQVLFLDFQKK